MEYNKLCGIIRKLALETSDTKTKIALVDLYNDIEKNGIEEEFEEKDRVNKFEELVEFYEESSLELSDAETYFSRKAYFEEGERERLNYLYGHKEGILESMKIIDSYATDSYLSK